MAKDAQTYEPDEFDELAAQTGPVGVHRAPRPWWSRVLPPVLAFLIAGAVAYLIAFLLWNAGGNNDDDPAPATTVTTSPTSSPETSPTTSPSAEPSATPSESASPSPTPTPTETEEPEPVIVYDAQVQVRNGSGIQGLAGEQQSALNDAGYSNVDANNIASNLIPNGVNTVTYADESLADTAQDIADTLGIDAVDGSGTPGGAEIEVLLASDPG
ncbi:LytR C-terminal domain-containing protein [Demequina globuliformis]|uniref:LytR C-terminal domain-containing protein n=1 Tax=Demequina globuliformis TaxID=676202 RepID=UPI000782E154|nr:LytR C-terminal domain-containing protein [Demequina globuliformis]